MNEVQPWCGFDSDTKQFVCHSKCLEVWMFVVSVGCMFVETPATKGLTNYLRVALKKCWMFWFPKDYRMDVGRDCLLTIIQRLHFH